MSQPPNTPLLSYHRGASRWSSRSSAGSIVLRLTGPFVWIPAALFALGCVGSFAFAGLFYLGPLLAPAFAYLAVSFVEMIMRSLRERRARVVLTYLENAVRLNLPLPVFLAAAERSERWATRRRLVHIRLSLSSGLTLGAAIDENMPELPPRWASLISAGELNGNLGEALSRLVDEDFRKRDNMPIELGAMRHGYLLTVLFAAVMLTTGIMIFVVPKFREIFKDFKTTLPRMTEFLLAAADWVANDWGWIFLGPPLIILMIILMARILRKAFVPGWPPLIPTAFFQWVLWHVPLSHGLLRDRAMADICQVLADGLRQRRPLSDALATARGLDIPEPMRRCVENWRLAAEAGHDPASGAAAAGMPALAVQFLRSLQTERGPAATTAETEPKLMEFLANHYRSRFSRTAIVIRSALEPIIVVVMALLVGYIVVALFLPLVKLINTVEEFSGDML